MKTASFALNSHHLRTSRASKTTSEGLGFISPSSVPLLRGCLSPCGTVGAACAAWLRFGGSGGQAGTHRRRHTCGSTGTRLTTARAGSPRHTPPRSGCSWAQASPGAAVTGKTQASASPGPSHLLPQPSTQTRAGSSSVVFMGSFPDGAMDECGFSVKNILQCLGLIPRFLTAGQSPWSPALGWCRIGSHAPCVQVKE